MQGISSKRTDDKYSNLIRVNWRNVKIITPVEFRGQGKIGSNNIQRQYSRNYIINNKGKETKLIR